MKRGAKLAWWLCLPLLAGCVGRSPLHGHWEVDLQATVEQARRDGITAQAVPQIRAVYGGGRMEITGEALVMRVDGMPEAVARNYRVLGEQDGCYQMAINGAPGTHAYCLRGTHLLVHDPATPLTVVFRRAS
ncbi:MAG TPA: hypothetical protein VIP30_00385 [Stenotrophomonas sp.]|jgi:predicted Zn-dependent protease